MYQSNSEKYGWGQDHFLEAMKLNAIKMVKKTGEREITVLDFLNEEVQIAVS
jgi:hypothetical protein